MRYWDDVRKKPLWPTPHQNDGQEAPIQRDRFVPMEVAEEAWKEYAAQGHGDQSLERINQRNGFGASELAILLYHRIKRLEYALSASTHHE